MKVLVRGVFAYDADKVSSDTGLFCADESLTVQADKEECDINTLVKRFGITGEMPQRVRPPIEADFIGITDYHTALNALHAADDTFMEFPAEVRARFNHDAGAFVQFCSDPANLPEMRKLGLAVPEDAPLEPLEVRVISEAAAS